MIGRAPMIGRDRELAELRSHFAAAVAGAGRLVLLSGDAGIGKTRLAETAITDGVLLPLRGAATARGAIPYGPIVAALRDHLRHGGRFTTTAPLGIHLGTVLPELGTPPTACDRATLFEAIARAFTAIADAGATVVFLDDIHWADAATLDLLRSLAVAIEGHRLLILAAYRSDELPRGHALRGLRVELRRAGRLAEIEVPPLDAAASGMLVEHLLGRQPAPSLRAAIYDRTQGVPFFIEEFAVGLAASGRLVQAGDRVDLEPAATVPIPQTIRDTAHLRLTGLSAAARATLEIAATIGRDVPLGLLSALGDEAEIETLLERGLLYEDELGTARFRHDLTREAFYADIHWPRRRALHADIAESLEAERAEPRLIADHWLAARRPERARPLLVEAARRSCRLHAYRDAAEAGRAALEVWPDGEDELGRLAVLDELGRCAQFCGELAEATRVWEECTASDRLEDDAGWAATISSELATAYELQGDTDRAADARRHAAELFERGDLLAEAASERLALAGSLFSADPPGAIAEAGRALAAAGRAGRTDLEARALSLRGFCLGLAGDRDGGLSSARQALRIASADDVDTVVDAYWTIGTVANFWADYTAAESAFDAAAELCRRHGRRPEENTCVTCLGLVLFNRGDWTRAEALAREVLASAGAPDHAVGHAVWILGIISTTRGATKRGRTLLRKALKHARELPMPVMEVQSRLGLALADELEGTGSALWADLVADPPPHLTLTYAAGLRWAATFAARRGDRALARACADGLSAWVSRFAGADALGGLAHALGEVLLLDGEDERAAEHLMRAVELLTELDAPFELAHSRARAGVALARIGEREAAIGHLVDAHRAFRTLRARPFANQAAAALEALDEPVARHLGRRAAQGLTHGGLTGRQMEVLRLVAVGRTNREIAAELVLSTRTVDMHVRNILTQLACRSRAEATARAHEFGLLPLDA
jgi:DNA-binding CsgD family transcriptional regulator